MESVLTPFQRWILISLLVLFTYTGLFAKRGWLDWRRMIAQNEALKERIEEQRKKKEWLDHKIASLKSNKVEQERLIRQVLGYVRPNETVVEFD